jgi:hypothetical protein
MENTNFKYYKVDLADIWEYEREEFIAGGTNEKLAQKIIDLIQPYYIKYGEPSFGKEMIKINSKYYGRNVLDYHNGDLKMKYALDYFIYKNDCYEYCQSVIISKEEKDHDFFFALKLRQYNDNLFEVSPFLKNHLPSTFDNDSELYVNYLKITLFQYDSFFQEGLKAQIKEFILMLKSQNIEESIRDLSFNDSNPDNTLNELNSKDNIAQENHSSTKKPETNKLIVGMKGEDSIIKNIEVSQVNKCIWAGSDEQLHLFYKHAIDILFNGISEDEFINHFRGKRFQNNINWLAGNEAFIELFDKLVSEKLINQQFIKQNSQFRNRSVIMISKINGHFVFNNMLKDATSLSKSRYQFYQLSGKSVKHDIIDELIKEIIVSQ